MTAAILGELDWLLPSGQLAEHISRQRIKIVHMTPIARKI